MNQPSYAPSEIYQDPQAPVDVPHDEQSGPRPEEQEITIYYNQKLLISYKRICKVLLAVLIVVLLGFSFLIASSFIPSLAASLGTPPIEEKDIFPLALLFVILLAAIAFLAWWVRIISSLASPSRKPVLHITHEGITIQNNILVRHRFIRWNEIETLYAGNVHLKIRSAAPVSFSVPTPEQPQKHRVVTTLATLMYLDTSAQDMLQQIRELYAYELSHYAIQFRP
jgi:hypothetical protein